jgi:large subunit ribosomal protein L17
MRHRKRGRVLGRSPSHRRALFRNLASSLFLTESDPDLLDSKPAVPGRIITTLEKAKEVRPLVERCITIARKSLVAEEAARQFATSEERGSQAWKAWRDSDKHAKWVAAMAPAVNARRRAFSMLRNRRAVEILFADVAPRFADRPGGYTRILRLAKPRLGDAGTRAILEFVGVRDRVTQRSPKPKFEDTEPATAGAQE